MVIKRLSSKQSTQSRRPPQVKSSKAQIQAKFHKIPVMRFEDQKLTSFSGLLIFQLLFKRLDLKQRLKQCFAHLKVSPIFGRHLVVLLLVIHLIIGFRRLRDVDYYRDDPMVLRLMGLRKLPDVSTISRALSQMETRGVENVRCLSRSIVIEALRRENLPRLTFDFDGSVQSTKGHAEGTAVGFNKTKKGARSYYPLFCTVAQTGQFFDLYHRPGNTLIVSHGRLTGGSHVVLLNCGNDFNIELIEPLGENSPVSNALKKGGGLNHICYETENFDQIYEKFKNKVVRHPRPAPQEYFKGGRTFFAYRRGGLVEFLEVKK